MALYQEDLAFVHAAAFGGLAAGAIPAVLARLRASPVRVRRVIDVGCGAGITTRALVAAGFDTIAIDPSPALLAVARAAAPGARFVEASAYEAPLEPCGAILAIGEPLSYHPPEADADALLRRFFRNASAALAPGGMLMFDLLVRGDASLDTKGWARADDWAILYETREDRAAGRLVRSIETFRRVGDAYRRAREEHHVRVFDEAALRATLDAEGFAVETARAYGEQPLAPRRLAFFATCRA